LSVPKHDRRYVDAPYLDEHAASQRDQDRAPRGFAGLLRWYLEGFWAETPEAVHSTGTWFGRPPRTDAQGQPAEDVASYQPPDPDAPPAEPIVLSNAVALTGGSVLGAPRQAEPFRQLLENSPRQTAGDGTEEHYVRPMRAALARLAGRDDGPLTARFLLQVAYAQGDWRAVAERWFAAYPVVHRPFIEHALRRLYAVYRSEPPARPVGPGWLSMSESQRRAIEAGEKGKIA
jgi:hypothetical protein